MRTTIFVLLVVCLASWFGFALILSGFLKIDGISSLFPSVQFPETTSEVGASLNILQGLFSSLAIVFALVAVFIQGKELKESTDAQREQARALSSQIEMQAEVIQMNAYSTHLQFLVAEIDRLEDQIQRLVTEAEVCDDQEKSNEKWKIIKNSRKLHGKYREEAKEIYSSVSVRLNMGSRGRYAEI